MKLYSSNSQGQLILLSITGSDQNSNTNAFMNVIVTYNNVDHM